MRFPIILTVTAGLFFATGLVMASQAADEEAIKKASEQRTAAYNAKDAKPIWPSSMKIARTAGMLVLASLTRL